MDLFDKYIYEYTTGRRKNPNLKYKYKDSDDVLILNIGSLSKNNQYKVILKKKLYGKILDVGAGLGRHSRLVPNTYSLDSSNACCNYMRSRGFPNVIELDILDHYNKYDSILLTGNNLGMTGNYNATIKFIKHLKSLLNENGQLIFDYIPSVSKTITKECNYFEKNIQSFDYIITFLSENNIKEIAKEIGMHFEILLDFEDKNLARFYFNDKVISVNATSRSGHNFFMNNIKAWVPSINIDNRENSMKFNDNGVNFIFIRDYINTIASVIKMDSSNHPNIIKRTTESWVFLYNEILNENRNIIPVYYEKFTKYRDYRVEICKLIDGVYNEDELKLIPQYSASSSFDKRDFHGKGHLMKVNDRWKKIQEDSRLFEKYLKILSENSSTLKLYVDNYEIEDDKIDFLNKYDLI